MKKHIFIILLALLLLLCACQPTPEKEFVASKSDQQQMIEKAQETQTPVETAIPAAEHIKEQFSDHGVSVAIDATVSVPKKEMPIVRVHGVDFTQEQVDRIWNVLIGDTVMYYDKDGDGKNPVSVDSALIMRDDGVTMLTAVEKPYGQWWETDGKYFHVLNNRTTPYGKGKPLNYDATLDYRYAHTNEEYYEDVLERDLSPIEVTNETPDGISLAMTPKEAMEQASEWMKRLDLPFEPMRITPVRNEAKQYAYLVECSHVINETPTAVMDGYSRLDPKTSVAVDWYYESMKLLLSDAGLLGFRWESPVEADETIVETSQLLPFDVIMGIFRKMMPIRYASSFEDRTELFQISEIRLELVRVLEQNVPNSGLLIPVWCFYGTNRTDADASDWVSPETYGCHLMLNAVDGSIIDPQQGY